SSVSRERMDEETSAFDPVRLQSEFLLARRERHRPVARGRSRDADRGCDRDLGAALGAARRRHAARKADSVIGKFRYRFERFGGILMFSKPALLITAGRKFLRSCGLDGGAKWNGPEESTAVPRLSAPVEAHLALTNACTAGCAHCYQS